MWLLGACILGLCVLWALKSRNKPRPPRQQGLKTGTKVRLFLVGHKTGHIKGYEAEFGEEKYLIQLDNGPILYASPIEAWQWAGNYRRWKQ